MAQVTMDADVVVVRAGLEGAAIAYGLVDRNLRVLTKVTEPS